MKETPTITSSQYESSAWSPMTMGSVVLGTNTAASSQLWAGFPVEDFAVKEPHDPLSELREFEVRSRRRVEKYTPDQEQQNMSNTPKKEKRLIQVYIVDPHPDVPLDKSVLYSQPTPTLTDATDQELFFQIDMKQIMHDHNQVRVKVVDKEASNRFNKEVYLEPIRIRDLIMNVITIARF